jgi:hypothetical protein
MEARRQQLESEVHKIAEQNLLGDSVETLARQLAEKYRLDVPTLDLENAVAEPSEATVEVSGPSYGLSWDEVRAVPGTRITLDIPFTGNPEMFRVCPSSSNSLPTYAKVHGHKLILEQSGTKLNANQVQVEFDRDIDNINSYLDWLRNDAQKFNDQLPTLARQLIEVRRKKVSGNQELVAGLKFKLKART